MVTREIFLGIILGLALQRLAELRLSAANQEELQQAGGRLVETDGYGWMRAVHVAWFAAMLGEVYWAGARPQLVLVVVGVVALAAGQFLRYSAIRALGPRWTVRVVVLPGEPVVRSRIYRYLRHPNYLGVALELAGVPLLHGAYITAVTFTLLNALVLRHRIRVEEAALAQFTDYHDRSGPGS